MRTLRLVALSVVVCGTLFGQLGRLQAGYSVQLKGFIVGVEGDIYWSDVATSRSIGPYDIHAAIDTFGTVRGRIGVEAGRFCPTLHNTSSISAVCSTHSETAIGSTHPWPAPTTSRTLVMIRVMPAAAHAAAEAVATDRATFTDTNRSMAAAYFSVVKRPVDALLADVSSGELGYSPRFTLKRRWRFTDPMSARTPRIIFNSGGNSDGAASSLAKARASSSRAALKSTPFAADFAVNSARADIGRASSCFSNPFRMAALAAPVGSTTSLAAASAN